MVKEEIVMGLNVLYKMCKKEDRTQEELEMNIYVWEEIFGCYTYQEFKLAIMLFLKNDVYRTFPSPGSVHNHIISANKPRHRQFTEVWSEIWKAIQDSTYHSKERFEGLSQEAKEIVRNPDNLRQWAMTEDLNLEVVSSNLNKVYESNCKQIDMIYSTPKNLRIGKGFEVKELETKKHQVIESKDDQEPKPENKVPNFSLVDNLIADLKKKLSS